MARRSKTSQQKRQRELRKAQKAERKRAKRHGIPEERPPALSPILFTEGVVGEKSASSNEQNTEHVQQDEQK